MSNQLSLDMICPPKCIKGFQCKKNVCVKNITQKIKTPSPIKVKTPSPIKVKTPSPIKVKTPSPIIIKPKRKYTKKLILVEKLPSPIKVKTPSPIKVKTPSPIKAKTPSPIKVKTPSPIKVKTPSPIKVKTPSTIKAKPKRKYTRKLIVVEKTPSPIKVKTPSPIKVKTPSPIKVKTPSPIKVKTPSPSPSLIKVKTPSPSPSPIKTVRLIYKAQPNSGIMKDVSIIKNALKTYKILEVNMIDKKEHTLIHEKVFHQIFIEHIFITDYDLIFPAKKSFILINHEWVYDWDIDAIRKGVLPLCKTVVAYNIFKNVLILNKPIYIGFGNNEAIPEYREKIKGLAIHFAGTSPTKGTLSLVKSWDHYIHKQGVLIIGCSNEYNQHKALYDFWNTLNPHKNVLLPKHIIDSSPLLANLQFERVGTLYLHKGSFEHNTKVYLQSVAELHICPSIIEGWGHYIDEARRNSSNVLVLDAPPMNELIIPFIIHSNNKVYPTGQCIPAIKNGELQNVIGKSWTSSLQTIYPIMTYAPTSELIMSDYIKKSLISPRKKITQEAISFNLERSIEDGERFVESINILLSDYVDSGEYFNDLLYNAQMSIQSIPSARIVYKSWGIKNKGIFSDVDVVQNILTNYAVTMVDAPLKVKDMIVQEPVDIQIFLEHIEGGKDYKTLFPAKRSYLIVNQEFLSDWDMSIIESGAVIAVCKTYLAMELMRERGINPVYISFCSPKHLPIDLPPKLNNLVIHTAGSSSFKNTWLTIDAWNKFVDPFYSKQTIKPVLVVTMMVNTGMMQSALQDVLKKWRTLRSAKSDLPFNVPVKMPQFEKCGNIYLCQDFLSHEAMDWLQKSAEIHICASLTEGWGHYINEARRIKAVVVTLDAPPMNELITPECGILVPATSGPPMYTTEARFIPVNYNPPTFIPASQKIFGDKIIDALSLSQKDKELIGQNAQDFSEKQKKQSIELMSKVFSLDFRLPKPSPYCCPNLKNKQLCSKINTNLINRTGKFAIVTLMFGGDSYLPGVLMLGRSIKPTISLRRNFVMCCMVTNDVSTEARSLISKIYDEVIEVDYIKIDPKLIRHKIPAIRETYSKTFTKLRIFEFYQFNKVLFFDADMLVLNSDIISLFNLDTPASIFTGRLNDDPRDRYFKDFVKNGNLFKQFQEKYCNFNGNELHGNLIPYTKGVDDEEISNGMNIETSILLITPSPELVKKRDEFISTINKPIHGDTEMISRMFKEKIYAIDPRFFGRWVNPYEHPELAVLDLYGTNGKPWDINKLNELAKYAYVGDVIYWWKTYTREYELTFKNFHNDMLDKLYKSIMSNKPIVDAMNKYNYDNQSYSDYSTSQTQIDPKTGKLIHI
jgi:hypothetical protein